MKKIILIYLAFFASLSAYSQKEINKDGLFRFHQSSKLKKCDATGQASTDVKEYEIGEGWKFYISRNSGDKLVIRFLKWPFDESLKQGEKGFASTDANKKLNQTYRGTLGLESEIYFLLPLSEFNLSCEEIQPRTSFTFGTATTLIKYRPGSKTVPGEIGNNINIGAMAGFKIENSKKVNHYLLLGASIGSVKLTPETTNNAVTSESDRLALTPNVGYILEVNKVQLSVFGGMDILSGNNYKDWIYRGRPWIGLGIGFSIFKINNTSGGSQD